MSVMIDLKTRAHTQTPADVNLNLHITSVLEQLTAQIALEQIIDGDRKHIFRLRNIQRGIKLISQMPKIQAFKDLKASKGIGDGIRRRVAEIIRTGTLQEVQSVNQSVHELLDLGKVHGIGPKLLQRLYHAGIKSVAMLRQHLAMDMDMGLGLPDGIKIYTATRIALKYHESLVKRVPRDLISDVHLYLRDHIPAKFEICGSYRRKKSTSGDIDILVMQNEHLTSLTPLLEALQQDGFLVAQLSGGSNKYNGICKFREQYCRIDFLLTTEQEFYPALLHFTGSGLFNQIIRWHANKHDYKLSNLGLSHRTDPKFKAPIFQSEMEIFEFLGVRYLEPWERDL